MSELFNPMPADLARALADHSHRQRFAVEEEAIRALEHGLAFEDDMEECPQMDGALQASAAARHA